MALQEHVGLVVRDRRLFRPRQRVLVAVSGGVDSMVLLHILHSLSRSFGWKLTVAHFNHQLRGISSRADERLVRRIAGELELPIVVSQADVRAFGRERGLSIEMAARQLRHDFLARTAIQNKIPSVALAHHLDDQLELFFLRLFRGSGGQGLAGMKWSSSSPANRAVGLVRPLLNCSKKTLLDYAAEHRVLFREDSSNACLDIQRNRIRHKLLPLLRREYQAGLDQSVLRIMDIVGAESEFVTATAQAWLSTNAIGKRNGFIASKLPLTLSVDAFAALPIAIQRRCLQLQLHQLGISVDYDLVEQLRLQRDKPVVIGRGQLSSWTKTQEEGTSKPPGKTLRLVCKSGLISWLNQDVASPFQPGFAELDLGKGGELEWHGVKLAWSLEGSIGQVRPEKASGLEAFDADIVGSTALLRHWQPGDRFQPIGMDRPVKLQDLFVNQKVARENRRRLLVAATGLGELFWVEGLRISERFKLTKGTIRRLHWSWRRL